jgi:formylglycine-generating enzyme required for sulfatase activity
VLFRSEAEWEYACRAGTTTPFNTGETLSTDQANFNGNYAYGDGKKGVYRAKTTPVGSFKPNAWGLYDMHGNVWQWCADLFGDYPNGPVTDPGAGTSGTDRLASHVMRGGSFGYVPENCRSAIRHAVEAKSTSSSVGFRVAADIR